MLYITRHHISVNCHCHGMYTCMMVLHSKQLVSLISIDLVERVDSSSSPELVYTIYSQCNN